MAQLPGKDLICGATIAGGRGPVLSLSLPLSVCLCARARVCVRTCVRVCVCVIPEKLVRAGAG